MYPLASPSAAARQATAGGGCFRLRLADNEYVEANEYDNVRPSGCSNVP